MRIPDAGNLISWLNERLVFKQWEIAKYALAAFFVFLPGLGRYFHYLVPECLLTFLAFFCLIFGLTMMFQVRRKWLMAPIAIGIFGIAYQIGIGKPVGFQILTAMYETNHREMMGFLSSPASIPLILIGVAVLIFILWVIVNDRPLPGLHKETSVRRRLLCTLMGVSVVLFFLSDWKIRQTYPFCLFYNNYMYIDEKFSLHDYRAAAYSPPDSTLSRVDEQETMILIIGEAARRSSHSAYGYPRKTTPCLDAFREDHPDNVILFQDAITTCPFTKASVMSLYSPLSLPEEVSSVHTQPGLSKIFRGSGWKTLYVTTRPKYTFPNMLSVFLDDAEKTVYLTTLTQRKFDAETIPIIKDFMTGMPGRKFMVLHLMGSHIEYDSQYPKEFRCFQSGNRMVDTYDNSIRYSDHVIGQIVQALMEQPFPGCILYVSDHGENLNDDHDKNYGHGTKALTTWEFQVPFVFFANDSYLKEHRELIGRLKNRKDLPVCHDLVPHTLLGLAGIRDPAIYQDNQDLSSADFHAGPRYIADENMNIYDFAKVDFSDKGALQRLKRRLQKQYLSKFTQ